MDDRPAVEPYRPAGQTVHVPVMLYFPGGHGGPTFTMEPGSQYLPGAQGPLQVWDIRPSQEPYRPARQFVNQSRQDHCLS